MVGGRHESSTVKSNIPALVAVFLAALTTGGNIYAFGLYGSALKKALHLSQSQLDTISSATFCAGLLSWIPGGFADKYGPRFALTFGGLSVALSMLCFWMVARKFFQLPVLFLIPTLCLFGVLIFLGTAMVIGGVFKTFLVTCGPETRGSAVGAAKGYVGLGAGVFACMFRALRRDSISDLDFLPFAAVCSILAVTIPARIFVPTKQDMTFSHAYDKLTPWHMTLIYFGLIGLGSLVIGTSVASIMSYEKSHSDVDQADGPSSAGAHYWMACLLFSFWFGPILALLLLPTDEDEDEQVEEFLPLSQAPVVALNTVDEASSGLSGSKIIEIVGLYKDEGTQRHSHDEGYSLWEMLHTMPAWLLAWICIICVGGGTMMTNNIGQMVEARYLPEVVTPASLALFSAAQAISRVVTGATSDAAQNWTNVRIFGNGVPRPAFLVAASLAEVLAHLVLSMASSQGMFVVGVALSGAAFGMIWPLMVLIIGEVFGTNNVGANYMFYDGGASAIGTLLLSKFLAQSVYESHIDENDENSDGVTCYGEGCFRASHIVVALLSLTCIVASLGMLRTTRNAYSCQSSVSEYGSLD